jgi:hypothetical protein
MDSSSNTPYPRVLISLSPCGARLFLIARNQRDERLLRRLAAELEPILAHYRQLR